MIRHPHSSRLTLVVAIALGITLLPGVARAQSSSMTVNELLQALFNNVPTPAEQSAGLVSTLRESAARFPVEVSKLVNLGLSSIPLSSSSAGFAYVRDAQTGEATLKSSSFGPLFVERPLTNGKGVWNVGLAFQRLSFDRLLGENVADEGIFVYDNRGIFPDGLQQFLEERATFKATVSTYTMTATYGVGRFFDLGIAVPVVSLDVTGGRVQNWDLTRSFATEPETRAEFRTPTGSRPGAIGPTNVTATGIGDIAIRGKLAFGSERTQPVALVADLRLPTGDEENLLGTGKMGAKFSLVAGKQFGDVSLYSNTGIATGGLVTAVDYAGAVDVAVGPRKQLTLALALYGQTTSEGAELNVLRTFDRVGTTGIRTTFDRNLVTDARLTTVTLAPSARLQLTQSLLLSAAVIVPVGDSGFQSGVSPTIGLDYTFGRR